MLRTGSAVLLVLSSAISNCAASCRASLPIGGLTNQFFANAYLNEFDQFIKHVLKVKACLRYVDDFVLLANDCATLLRWKLAIDGFLRTRLRLELHPRKTVLQRCNQGIDFLNCIVFPDHQLTRQRSVRALRRRTPGSAHCLLPTAGTRPCRRPETGIASWLATSNSYHGLFSHADTWRLRKHINHKELGPLKRFFLPQGPGYRHLRIRKARLPKP